MSRDDQQIDSLPGTLIETLMVLLAIVVVTPCLILWGGNRADRSAPCLHHHPAAFKDKALATAIEAQITLEDAESIEQMRAPSQADSR